MLVDDEPYNLDALRIIMQCATSDIKDFNFASRVDSAHTGLEAFELIQKRY